MILAANSSCPQSGGARDTPRSWPRASWSSRRTGYKLIADSVWGITTPAFRTRPTPECHGRPIKTVVWLSKPTTTTRVPPTSPHALAYPAMGVHVALCIQGIVDLLKGTAGNTTERKSFDLCGKFLGMGLSRRTAKARTSSDVAEAELTDSGGGRSR